MIIAGVTLVVPVRYRMKWLILKVVGVVIMGGVTLAFLGLSRMIGFYFEGGGGQV